MEALAIICSQNSERRFAKISRLLQHCLEHRREIAGRGVDDAEHLGGRGLLLQGLARLGNQARVLHRDDRLPGEILQQRDLPVAERPHLLAVDNQGPQQRIIPAQGDPEGSARTADIDHADAPAKAQTVGVIIGDVREVHDRFAAEQTRERTARSRPPRLPQILDELGRKPAVGDGIEVLAVIGQQAAKGRLAQPHRLFEDRIEDGAEIAGRGVDDLQDLGGRGLAGQSLIALGADLSKLAPQLGNCLCSFLVRYPAGARHRSSVLSPRSYVDQDASPRASLHSQDR
jgi:hypothetical protein